MTTRKDPKPEGDPMVPADNPEPPVLATEEAPDPPQPEPPPAPLPPQTSRGPGILGPLLGGALAAIGGFALSHFDVFGLQSPGVGPELAALTAQLEQQKSEQTAVLDQLRGDLATLTDRLARLETAPPPVVADLSRLEALEEELAALQALPADGGASTVALTARLADLEEKLAASPPAATDPELQARLDEALARLTEAEAAATARAADAEAAAAAAARRTALAALSAAVVSGQPFAAELQAMGDEALATSLGPLAATGVPTLASLQADFPPAARAALQEARAQDPEAGWGDRLVDFLADQTKARPLTPQEGDTPEAVLSRAEFALSEGRVADALSALAPLEPPAKEPLAQWVAAAEAHVAALAAVQAAGEE